MSDYETIRYYQIILLKDELEQEIIELDTFPNYVKGQTLNYIRTYPDNKTKQEEFKIANIRHSMEFKMNFERTKSFETYSMIIELNRIGEPDIR